MHWLLASVLLNFCLLGSLAGSPSLSQYEKQLFHDRLFQTNLRGPRWTGNDNHNTLTALVAKSMEIAGLSVETLNYTFVRSWDPRWWSLSLQLKNGTKLGLPTTGFWPYSGDSGLQGVTGPLHDAGTFGINDATQAADPTTLDLKNLSKGSVLFFDNPSPTRNYSEPGYHLLGTSRNIPPSEIPEASTNMSYDPSCRLTTLYSSLETLPIPTGNLRRHWILRT
ncbi:hypothetical protein AMATHDRAFT_145285 [Amanita thiersii Skay4041]|uniref:Glycoside hydrolase family 16 protein n=1 Tax=Amanita thiersii Skay4041 TaxID=703135 RepID=A0A2A9NRK7_9AGAR|nr:hypothetical protein AMATHDRAFT_145285 [Amanita thiersii Skay4041]